MQQARTPRRDLQGDHHRHQPAVARPVYRRCVTRRHGVARRGAAAPEASWGTMPWPAPKFSAQWHRVGTWSSAGRKPEAYSLPLPAYPYPLTLTHAVIIYQLHVMYEIYMHLIKLISYAYPGTQF